MPHPAGRSPWQTGICGSARAVQPPRKEALSDRASDYERIGPDSRGATPRFPGPGQCPVELAKSCISNILAPPCRGRPESGTSRHRTGRMAVRRKSEKVKKKVDLNHRNCYITCLSGYTGRRQPAASTGNERGAFSRDGMTTVTGNSYIQNRE